MNPAAAIATDSKCRCRATWRLATEISLNDTAVRSQPAVWTNPADQSTWVFIDNPNGLDAFQLTLTVTNTLLLQSKWSNFCQRVLPDANSPLIANGVLYVADPHVIEALDPVTGNVLWTNSSIGDVH